MRIRIVDAHGVPHPYAADRRYGAGHMRSAVDRLVTRRVRGLVVLACLLVLCVLVGLAFEPDDAAVVGIVGTLAGVCALQFPLAVRYPPYTPDDILPTCPTCNRRLNVSDNHAVTCEACNVLWADRLTRCPTCCYDVTGLEAGRCPECGRRRRRAR